MIRGFERRVCTRCGGYWFVVRRYLIHWVDVVDWFFKGNLGICRRECRRWVCCHLLWVWWVFCWVSMRIRGTGWGIFRVLVAGEWSVIFSYFYLGEISSIIFFYVERMVLERCLPFLHHLDFLLFRGMVCLWGVCLCYEFWNYRLIDIWQDGKFGWFFGDWVLVLRTIYEYRHWWNSLFLIFFDFHQWWH